jgi:trimeric autotransporter adhesin
MKVRQLSLLFILPLLVALAVVQLGSSLSTGLAAADDAATEATTARVLVAHLAPFSDGDTSVTVALNGSPALTDFSFGDTTGYLELPAGSYQVDIIPTGAITPAISGVVTLTAGIDYTAAAIGDGVNQPLELLALVDDNEAVAGKAKVRVVHAAPFAADLGDTEVDIRTDGGDPVLTNVPYKGVSAYLELDPGVYDLQITTPGGGTTLLDLPPLALASGNVITVIAIGDGSNQDVSFLLLQESGWLQVAHLAPFAMDPGTGVTVTLNGAPALTDFAYGDSTGYIELPTGFYDVAIFPAGSPTPAITATAQLMGDTYYSAIAVGDGANQNLGLVLLVDDLSEPAAGNFKLRLGHLAPFAPGGATADVRLADGTPVLEGVEFGDVTGFLELPAGTYDLTITAPGGVPVLINPEPVTASDGDIISAFATGEGSNQDLGVFAWPADMAGFFLPLQQLAYLQVAHLAPFAMDPGTAVTVTLNGAPALTNFVYGDSTPYIGLEPGAYDVAIFPAGSPTPAITATATLITGTYYSAIAIGDGANQDLSLVLLEDDLSAPAAGNFKLRLGHLAPFAPGGATADVRLADGTAVLEGVNFGDVAGFIELPAGTYDLIITAPGGEPTLIDPRPVTFSEGQIISAFATGEGNNQALGVFAWPPNAAGFFLPLTTDETLIYLPIIMRN